MLLAWVPLRERPGLGTLSNVVVVGLAVDAVLAVLPAPGGLTGRVAFAAAGILLNGVATAAYIGVVTVLYALSIGPLVHLLLPRFAVAVR